jgi:hypothetical protein
MSCSTAIHQVVFFKKSRFHRPQRVLVNCWTFHYIMQMSEGDADLFWANGKCFCCGSSEHRTVRCKWVPEHMSLGCTWARGWDEKRFGESSILAGSSLAILTLLAQRGMYTSLPKSVWLSLSLLGLVIAWSGTRRLATESGALPPLGGEAAASRDSTGAPLPLQGNIGVRSQSGPRSGVRVRPPSASGVATGGGVGRGARRARRSSRRSGPPSYTQR